VGFYTVLIVVLVGGGGDDGAGGKEPLSDLERRVERAVVAGKLPQRDDTDIKIFRKPEAKLVECEDERCRVVYSVAVPGRGRILIQQADIVAQIFEVTAVKRVNLEVVRGTPTGPSASAPADEETPGGRPVLETSCDRSKLKREPDWSKPQSQAVVSRLCVTRDFNQGSGSQRSGEIGQSQRGE